MSSDPACNPTKSTVVTMLLLIAAFLLATSGCDDPSSPSRSRPAAETADPSKPRLTIENPILDLGDVADYETRTAEVRFKNTGGDTLTVERVIPTCGCTTIGFESNRTFAPGEGGSFTLDFTPKSSGQQQKYIQVVSSDPLVPVTAVTLNANVIPTLEAEPRYLALGRVAYGEPHTGSIDLTALADDCTLTDVSFTGDITDQATASITDTTPEGTRRSSWRVDVDFPAKTSWGWHNGGMLVSGIIETTAGPRPISMRFVINGSFEGAITAKETLLALLSLRPSQKILKTTTLRRTDGTPFECTSATIVKSPEGLTATVEPTDSNRTEWLLTLAGNAPSKPGTLKGVIAITTNVPDEEIIEIQFAGAVMAGN